jgi:hypothetical protein
MDPIFVYGADRAFILEERTRSWVDTTTGSRHYCLRHCSSGSVLWGLWERIRPDGLTERFIACDLLVSSANGWGYRALLESDDLQYLSCPLAYLRASVPVSERWRARVEAYWRTPLHAGLRVRRRPAVKEGPVLQEGDRVRFTRKGDNKDGSLGTVTSVTGITGPTVHTDELCRTTFVRWDDGHAGSVFTSRIERIETAALADRAGNVPDAPLPYLAR